MLELASSEAGVAEGFLGLGVGPRALASKGSYSAGAHWSWSDNTRLGPSTVVIEGVTRTHRVNRIPMSFFPGSYNHKPQVLSVNRLVLFSSQ